MGDFGFFNPYPLGWWKERFGKSNDPFIKWPALDRDEGGKQAKASKEYGKRETNEIRAGGKENKEGDAHGNWQENKLVDGQVAEKFEFKRGNVLWDRMLFHGFKLLID